ncbi:hypothetical protein [Chitinophaga sp. Cy-1792]|uniref:DUF6892 domain-containing protein n=1 Tax=Chitinophaga sp. Cy-1792 TaxID=2608339 RepID=UPI001420175D|nr:hypothetical protein [Chitinophaga sp. Cy-1792]NIG55451.1 hypothetical protein [Chitinophaga sp. Cy-1792]
MKAAIIDNTIFIEDQVIIFPVKIQVLQAILGPGRHVKKKYNHIYTWDEAGLTAYAKDGKVAESIMLDISPNKYDFSPKQTFTDTFLINGVDYPAFLAAHESELKRISKNDDSGSVVLGDNELWFDIDEGKIAALQLMQREAPEVIDTTKYEYIKAAGEKIDFKDFNFKLAVVQVLMYEKGLLQPVFDLYDFVKHYSGRQIDIEAEGYAFIPEVTRWFEALEVDKRLATEITDIQQDGGDEIYGQLFRFWDGEDDTFNIKDFSDVQHFPNLKSMSLFYDGDMEQIKSALEAKGISVGEY